MSFAKAGRFAPEIPQRRGGSSPLHNTADDSGAPVSWIDQHAPLPEVRTRLVVPEQARVKFHTQALQSPRDPQKQQQAQAQGGQHVCQVATKCGHGCGAMLPSGQLEREYIDNLRVQVRYLEHEVTYLRQQLSLASEELVSEARRDAEEHLREAQEHFHEEWQQQQQNLQDAEERYEAFVRKYDRMEEQLQNALAQREDEKRALISKVQQLHKEVEVLQEACSDKDAHLQRQKNDMHSKITELAERDRRLRSLDATLRETQRACEKAKAVGEEREIEIVELKGTIEDLQERLRAASPPASDRASSDGDAAGEVTQGNADNGSSSSGGGQAEAGRRGETRALRAKLKQTELSLQESRALERRLRDDVDALVQENAQMANRITELEAECTGTKKQLMQEREARRKMGEEMRQLQLQGKQAHTHTQSLQENMSSLQDEFRRMEEILKNKEVESATLDQDNFQLREGLSHLRHALERERQENVQLKQDKVLLTDHLEEVRLAMESNAAEFEHAVYERDLFSNKVREQARVISFLKRMQNIRWSDLEEMATTVKEFTRDMGTQEREASGMYTD